MLLGFLSYQTCWFSSLSWYSYCCWGVTPSTIQQTLKQCEWWRRSYATSATTLNRNKSWHWRPPCWWSLTRYFYTVIVFNSNIDLVKQSFSGLEVCADVISEVFILVTVTHSFWTFWPLFENYLKRYAPAIDLNIIV